MVKISYLSQYIHYLFYLLLKEEIYKFWSQKYKHTCNNYWHLDNL